MSSKILIVEDDQLFSETLEDFLESENFEVSLAHDGKEALEKSFKNSYDLYLLDVKIPHINGFDFLKELRASGDDTPAIFITSLNDTHSLSTGYRAGCDDYLKKPIELNELLFKILAILKRVSPDKMIKIDDTFVFNTKRKQLIKDGMEINLNLKDLELLCLFLRERHKIVTKEMIKDALWNNNEYMSEGSIRVYINNLKKVFGKEAITNIRGIGYRFEK